LNGSGFGLAYHVLGFGLKAQVLDLGLGIEGQVLGLASDCVLESNTVK